MTQANHRGNEDREKHHEGAQNDDGDKAIADPQDQDGRDSDGGQRLRRAEEGFDRSGQQPRAVNRVGRRQCDG
jgi:hypothetical protein